MALRRRRRLVWQVSHETRLSPPPQMLLRSLRSCRSSKSARLVRSLILIYRLRQRRLLPVVRRCRLGMQTTFIYYAVLRAAFDVRYAEISTQRDPPTIQGAR